MKIKKKQVIRTPLLEQKISFDKAVILDLLKDAKVQEAIYLSSPNLYSKAQKIVNGDFDSNPTEELKTLVSIHNYLVRMSNTSTPFGLHAGVGVSGDKPDKNYPSPKFIRNVTLDNVIVFQLHNLILSFKEVREHLDFHVNTTLRIHSAEKYCYLEYEKYKDIRKYKKSYVEKNEILDHVLNQGSLNFTGFIELGNKLGYDEDDISEYFHDLVENQVLFPSLYPNPTTLFSINQLIEILKATTKGEDKLTELTTALEEVSNLLDQLNLNSTNDWHSAYEDILKLLSPHIDIERDKGHAFYVVSSFNEPIPEYSSDETRNLIEAIDFLLGLSKHYMGDTTIKDFASRFYEKYGENAVPIMDVLDSEKEIPLNNYQSNTSQERRGISLNEIQIKLLSLLVKCTEQNIDEIDLGSSEYRDLLSNAPSFENRVPDMGFAFTKEIFTHDNKKQILLDIIGGVNTCRLIARFGNAIESVSEVIQSQQLMEKETFDNNFILADVSHIPNERTNNIISGTSFNDYEINFISGTNPDKKQISLKDLYLKHDGSILRLYSSQYNKYVIPRLNSAYNFNRSEFSIYSFLCFYQYYDEIGGSQFRWPELSSVFKFFPRVSYKGIVLKKKTWLFKLDELEKLLDKKLLEDNKLRIDTYTQWCDKKGIPLVFNLVNGENSHLIDVTNIYSTYSFYKQLKKVKEVKIEEHFQHKGKTRAFERISFFKQDKIACASAKLLPELINTDETLPIPDLDFEYYKLYVDQNMSNMVLSILDEKLSSLSENSREIEYFFIRYNDPDYHLRIRVKSLKGSNLYEWNNFLKKLHSKQFIIDFKKELYYPEYSRYGGKSCINIIHKLFDLESKLIASSINKFKDDNTKMQVCFEWITHMIDHLSWDAERRIEFFENNSNSFAIEFNLDNREGKKILTNEYNDLFQGLQRLIQGEEKFLSDEIIGEQKELVYQIIQCVKDQGQINYLIASLIHLFVNRIFAKQQRRKECTIYSSLLKFQIYLKHNPSIVKSKEKHDFA